MYTSIEYKSTISNSNCTNKLYFNLASEDYKLKNFIHLNVIQVICIIFTTLIIIIRKSQSFDTLIYINYHIQYSHSFESLSKKFKRKLVKIAGKSDIYKAIGSAQPTRFLFLYKQLFYMYFLININKSFSISLHALLYICISRRISIMFAIQYQLIDWQKVS